MPDQEHEFDDRDHDGDDVDFIGPPLPPDDRLWRHPSEMSSNGVAQSASPSEPDAKRARFRRATSFLSGRPTTRAGALSAGLTGAMLATGLVLVGTHLAQSSGGTPPAVDATSVTVHETSSSVPRHAVKNDSPTAISGELQTMAARIGAATVLVTAYDGSHAVHGTGLVIASQCIVVTSYSLVVGAESLMLSLPGGKFAPAQVLGTDPATGIAVLRCSATKLATVNASSPVTVNTHELVAVVGTKPGGSEVLEFGFVSAPPSEVMVGSNDLLDVIRTDILDHSDGTALVGYDGSVIGLVVGNVNGVAVATPAWLAMAAANEIVRSGKVKPGVLGVRGVPVAGAQPGVRVTSVEHGGAAAKAGLRTGDVIESVDGSRTLTIGDLRAKLHSLVPGTAVSIVFDRHGKDLRVKAVLLEDSAAA
jgi:S1-C subfamily serine protease